MPRFALVSLLTLSTLLCSQPAQAAESYLSCQVELSQQDCTTVDGPWPANQPLLVGASCTECSGGGSDISCSPAELLNPGVLALETASGSAVAGTFSQVGTCAFGIPLFRFSGSLTAGTSYHLIATIPGRDRTLLLAFSTSGGTTPGADGSLPAGDSTTSPFDGNISATDSSRDPAGGDGGGGGGGGGGPGNATDGGCSCQLPGSGGALPSLLLALIAVLLLWRRQRLC